MNLMLVQKLIYKDWYFQRFTITAFLLAGVAALVVMGIPGEIWFAVGGIGLITLVITWGALLVSSTIVAERSSQTLVFLMSLPISMREYTLAKLLGNLAIFVIPWLMLLMTCVVVILSRPNLPDGLVAYALIVLVQMLICYCLVLCAALISESQGWVTVAILVGNLALQAFFMTMPRIPEVNKVIGGSSFVWNAMFSTILSLQVGFVVLLLGVTFYLQFKKTNFL